jgi:hypothetical protein
LLLLTRSLLWISHWLLISIILTRIWDLLRIALGLSILVDRLQVLLQWNMRSVILVAAPTLIFSLLGLESVALAAIVVGCRGDAVQLEPYTSRAGPGIRRSGIALDLASSASFAGSHH